MGVRSLVPALLLRVGKDQDCYDFVKWWANQGQDADYDWGDTSLPYLSVKDANIFEPVDFICRKHLDTSHIVAITLLKIRLFLAVQKCLQNSAILRERGSLPPEIFDQIQDSLLKSACGDKWDDMDSTKRSRTCRYAIFPSGQIVRGCQTSKSTFLAGTLEPRKASERTSASIRYGKRGRDAASIGLFD
ncbi:MAG: hypothetical protein M1818_006307 [Claussenomyces sp. TS43310]|nr:MAG: hypothetical protein M1818_006307 [Claussenomyces sp. TS43310]